MNFKNIKTILLFVFVVLVLPLGNKTIAQIHSVTHVVQKGETLYQLSKLYGVSVNELIEFNPLAKQGILENQKLIIPVKSKDHRGIIHVVQPSETIYGISKRYGISAEELLEQNPVIKTDGLQPNQKLRILSGTFKVQEQKNVPLNKMQGAVHQVAEGETLYAIARTYNVAVSEILEVNPDLSVRDLRIGQQIIIPNQNNAQVVDNSSKNLVKEQRDADDGFTTIQIMPKETIYSLEKKYNVSYGDLIFWNPELRDGLKSGMKIRIKTDAIPQEERNNDAHSTVNETKETFTREAFAHQGDIDIAVLIPFNLSKLNIKNPSIRAHLAKNVFTNIVLDFYSGVLLATENAPKNSKINVEILDSQESNRSMNMSALLDNLRNKEIVIGPFFQQNVDELCTRLSGENTFIFSPLSTELAGAFSKQIHTMPTNEQLKETVLDFINNQKGNTLFVGNFNEYEKNKINDAQSITSFKGGEVLKSKLDKSATNYVIVDPKAADLKNVISTLSKLNKSYKIQLVILEKNQNIDNQKDISIEDLMALELIYPSITNDEQSLEKVLFVEKYRNRYNVYPSKYAIRGYDIMSDVFNRAAKYLDTGSFFVEDTEQIDNKFSYRPSRFGQLNKGVYILQYTENGKIKRIY